MSLSEMLNVGTLGGRPNSLGAGQHEHTAHVPGTAGQHGKESAWVSDLGVAEIASKPGLEQNEVSHECHPAP